MRVANLACLLLSFAMQTLTAQSAPGQQETHLVSIRCAEYYAAVYRVPAGPGYGNHQRRIRVEPVCGLSEGRSRADAAHAKDCCAIRRAQSVSPRREHSWRSCLSCLAESRIRRRPAVSHSCLLRRRGSYFPAETRILVRGHPGLRKTCGETIPRQAKAGCEPGARKRARR